jgi:hypothetical protein
LIRLAKAHYEDLELVEVWDRVHSPIQTMSREHHVDELERHRGPMPIPRKRRGSRSAV